MKKPRFDPQEVLFSLTDRCNLNCVHCDVKKSTTSLDTKYAQKFIDSCADAGIGRIGFTGGEPFLAINLLETLIEKAVSRGFFFNRIMTNGAWFNTKKELVSKLKRIFRVGYDGDICISIDAFHGQNLKKAALFIEAVADIWKRPDMISIASVKGAKDNQTRILLTLLAHLLNARILFNAKKHASIRRDGLFIKILYIDLSATAVTAPQMDPWNGKWFKNDFCKGPGNVFFVAANGLVKPCCGYANDSGLLTIGSIKKDTPRKLLRNARQNKFISAIFGKGLHAIRRDLERKGAHFPGKTSDHCFFCGYLTSNFASEIFR